MPATAESGHGRVAVSDLLERVVLANRPNAPNLICKSLLMPTVGMPGTTPDELARCLSGPALSPGRPGWRPQY